MSNDSVRGTRRLGFEVTPDVLVEGSLGLSLGSVLLTACCASAVTTFLAGPLGSSDVGLLARVFSAGPYQRSAAMWLPASVRNGSWPVGLLLGIVGGAVCEATGEAPRAPAVLMVDEPLLPLAGEVLFLERVSTIFTVDDW